MIKEIEKYIKLGVNPDKIIFTKDPSIVLYCLSRKCLVNSSSGINALEVIKEESGNSRLSYENNRAVSLQIHKTININEINDSKGIIITDALYNLPNYFRFGFIPTK